MEDVIWQLETLQLIGAVVAFILSLSFFCVGIVNSWQIVEDIYRLAKDGIRAVREATEENPFAVNWENMNETLRQIAFMAFTVIVSGVVGCFCTDLFAAYVIAVSGA